MRSPNYVVVIEGDTQSILAPTEEVALAHAQKAEDRGEFAHIYALGDPIYSTEGE